VRTLLKKYIDLGNNDWVDVLKSFSKNLNETYNSTLKDTPSNVFTKYNDDENKNLKKNLKEKFLEKNPVAVEKELNIGDTVRILNKKKLKSNLKNNENIWSDEIYKIVKIIRSRNPNTRIRYRLENVKGTFIKDFLQVIKNIEEYNSIKKDKEGLKNKEIRDLEN
jgi:hypothetical protein